MNIPEFKTFDFSGCNLTKLNCSFSSNVIVEFFKMDSRTPPSKITYFNLCFGNVEGCKVNFTAKPWLEIESCKVHERSEFLDDRAERVKEGQARSVEWDIFDFEILLEGGGCLNILAREAAIVLVCEVPKMKL